MEIHDKRFYEAIKRFQGVYCHKILYIDITADQYEVLAVEDLEWEKKNKDNPSGKISEWFQWFADSPFCYEADRERFKVFTDLRSLQEHFEKTNYEVANFVYRRKFDQSERIYTTVLMELYPQTNEEEHLTAFLFVRNLTSEIQKYNAIVEEGLDNPSHLTDGKTILVVEDNDVNREILAEILSDQYSVLQAENGADGLEMLQKYMTKVSLVVVDIQMPVMNGYEFLEHVQRDPFLSRIPIVVATGSDSIEEERKCLQLGASDFVTKPYNADIIKSRISSIIRLRDSNATLAMIQTDERTGLYTLQAFYYYAKHTIDKAIDKSYSVTILDIDHFKTINEIYGEEAGDRVLHEVADALKDYTAAGIYGRADVSRFLLLSETMTAEQTDTWIKGLFASLQSACSIKRITFKAGIYNNVDRSLPISVICDRAIFALNSVGQSFENRYSLYDERNADKERRLAAMEAGMLDAYEKKQFSVYYQPKHDAYTGKLIGAEALIRWNHPEYGFLSPGDFIPLFERNGFISYADYYVLKKTCKNLRCWSDEGILPVPISFNASRRDFERENCVDLLINTLCENMVDPALIHIEVTETLFSDRLDEMGQLLQKCRDAGFSIELDDFGSGYSSLTTLASLPLDVMKLDMSFMRDYKDDKKLKILSTCIGLAHSLGMKTVSEGVETEEQLELLKKYGCDWIQGYYFSGPLPEDEFNEYLIRYSKDI